MRLIDHFSKAAWAFADKALPLGYSIGAILLIIRVLPKEEYGYYILIQGIAFMMIGLSSAFSLVPMVKFSSESRDDGSLATMGFLLHSTQLAILTLLCWIFRHQLGVLFHKQEIASLVVYVPLMALAGEIRFYTMELLRIRYRIAHIFWVDAAYFVASLLFVVIFTLQGRFLTGANMCQVTVLALAFSSLTSFLLSRDLIPRKPQFRRESLKKIAGFGKFTLGAGLSYEVNDKADILLIGMFLNPAAVATYTVAKIIWRSFSVYVQVVEMLVMPGVSRLHSENRTNDIAMVYEKTVAFSYLLIIPLGIAMLALAHPAISIIYGARYIASVPVLRILAVFAFVVVPAAIGTSLLTGMGLPQTVFRIRWFATIINLALCIALIPISGLPGAAIAVVVSMGFASFLVHHQVKKHIAVSYRKAFSNIRGLPSVVRELWNQFRQREA
jgi:O-antigen/teichoic acid export membrane protein